MTLALRSPLLAAHGFLHGFSLRTGGASAAPFESLNLGRAVGDDPGAVAENHRRFAQAVGYAPDALREVTQVHGAAVEVVDATPVEVLRTREADALVSAQAQTAVGVRVADCAAILLAHPPSGAVAAVHAGWRGAVGGVIEAAVVTLCGQVSAARHTLLAAVFPCISVDAFEVGEDVAEQLAKAAGTRAVIRSRAGSRPHADLAATVLLLLVRAGLVAEQVDHVVGCTVAERERFFSHRRDAGRTGRHLAAIVPRC